MADDDIPRGLRITEKFAGIIAAIGLPIAIPLATCIYGQGEKVAADQRACIDLRLKSVAAVAQSKTPGADDAVALMTDTLKLLNKLCPEDLKQDKAAQQAQARDVAHSSNDPKGVAKLMPAAGAAAPPAATGDLKPSEGLLPSTLHPSAAVISEVSKIAGLTPEQAASPNTTRIFIQVASAAEAPAAQVIRARLNKARYGTGPIVAPGVETVANTLPQPELRCLKVADCQKAQDQATFLGVIMGGKPPAIRNFSKKYEADANVKAGTYELWFGPGDLPATATPPPAASS
jgi:hypothetical protein